jgi:hypothetical protein
VRAKGETHRDAGNTKSCREHEWCGCAFVSRRAGCKTVSRRDAEHAEMRETKALTSSPRSPRPCQPTLHPCTVRRFPPVQMRGRVREGADSDRSNSTSAVFTLWTSSCLRHPCECEDPSSSFFQDRPSRSQGRRGRTNPRVHLRAPQAASPHAARRIMRCWNQHRTSLTLATWTTSPSSNSDSPPVS